jgi:AcrR family transcriptional regulator
LKNPVGRPKLLDRDNIINIALNQYWIYGIDNVTISSIASLANISRPGIYKEFIDEDGLKYEVLKKYTCMLKEFVIPQYNSAKDIKTIYYHLHSTIGFNTDKKYFEGISQLKSILPKEVDGCFYENVKLKKHTLDNKTKREVDDFEKFRKNIFLKYLKELQETGQIISSLDIDEIYEFISAQLSLSQSLSLNGMNKETIKIIINKALSAIVTPKYTLN